MYSGRLRSAFIKVSPSVTTARLICKEVVLSSQAFVCSGDQKHETNTNGKE